MYTIGIDPGLSGAIALRLPCGYVVVRDVPTRDVAVNRKRRKRLDDSQLIELLAALCVAPISRAMIEPAVGITGQSASAAAAFGDIAGALRLALASALRASGAACPVVIEPSNRWKPRLGVPSDKNEAIRVATRLMPESAHQWRRAKDHGRAEAALLAYYAAHCV